MSADVTSDTLRSGLVAKARELGFSLVGVASPDPSDHLPFYRKWIDEGLHGEMEYLAREDAVARRADLSATMEGVRSVVVVAHEYYAEDAADVVGDPSRGIIARYARGADYHRVLKGKLKALGRWIDERVEDGVEVRSYVDTGPILERELGRRAGLGWFGRNTMLIHPKRGSYFFLGALLLDVDLEPSDPLEADHCGSCHACLYACPTGALLGRDADGAPVIDARRCISYLTIEHRGPIPLELRPLIGNRIYGCDICQEVCPFNVRFAEESAEPRYAARGPGERPPGVEALPGEGAAGSCVATTDADTREVDTGGNVSRKVGVDGSPEGHVDGSPKTPSDVSAETSGDVGHPVHPGTEAPSLVALMRMTPEDWDTFTRGSAIRRAGYGGFKRNVAVAMGNWFASVDEPPEEAVAALRGALDDENQLVREHAAWALGQAE